MVSIFSYKAFSPYLDHVDSSQEMILIIRWFISHVGQNRQYNGLLSIYSICYYFYSSFEVTAVVKKKEKENKFRYTVKKLPGDIVPEKCKTEVIIKTWSN